MEKRHSFKLGDPYVFDQHLQLRGLYNQDTGQLQLPLPTDDSPEESHDALMHYKQIRPQDVYPQNVTRKYNTFSL